MCNGIVLIQSNGYQMLCSVFFTLTDCFRNFNGFAQTYTYMSVAIAYYY